MFKPRTILQRIVCYGILLCLSSSVFATNVIWEIRGIDQKTQENIHKRLSASRVVLGTDVTSAELQRFLNEAVSNTELAVQPFGYFHTKIKTNYRRRHNQVLVQLNITPGARTLVRHVNIKLVGQGARSNQNLVKQFGINPGSPLSIPIYQEAKAMMFNHLQARGYIKAQLQTSQVLIDRNKNTADITVTMDTGDRYYFGLVTFSKNPMDPMLLARYISCR